MPYHRHYSLSFFRNQGELAVDNFLFSELRLQKDKWVSLHSINLNKLHQPTKGECDFIVITTLGIIVLEVKASEVKIENGVFYQQEKGEYKERPDFFTQAIRNANFIIQILHEKGIKDVMVINACVFPESTFYDSSGVYGAHWSLHTKNKLSLSDFILQELKLQRKGFADNAWVFNDLNSTKIDSIASLLSPQITPVEVRTHLLLQTDEAKNKAIFNLQMLDGLRENRRLMVQGPAGSGKSTFAKKLAVEKALHEKKRVLYLCWNELLSKQIESEFNQSQIDLIEVFPLYHFWVKLCKDFDLESPADFNWVQDQAIRNAGLKAIYSHLLALSAPLYDYVVVDEAQDIFHFDLFTFVCNMLGNNQERSYALFYDNTQSFPHNQDSEEYQLNQEFFKDSSAIYLLHQRYRGIAGIGLFEFLRDLETSIPNLSKNYGSDVIIKKYTKNQIKEMMETIISLKKQMKVAYQIDFEKQILLFGSNLVSGLVPKERPLDSILSEYAKDFCPLNKDNFLDTKNVVFSTPGTVKGLERDIVYLVVSDYLTKQHLLKEFYLGASRAKVRLYVFVLDNE